MGIHGERLDGKHYNIEGKSRSQPGSIDWPLSGAPLPWPDWGEWGPES